MAIIKNITVAGLKAVVAGLEGMPLVKGTLTFFAELAGMTKDKREKLEQAQSQEQLKELLTQAELATYNTALAAAGAEQMKTLIANFKHLDKKHLEALSKLIADDLHDLRDDLHNHGIIIDDTNKIVRTTSRKIDKVQTSVDDLHEKVDKLQPPVPNDKVSKPIQNIPSNSLGNLFKGRQDDFNKLIEQINDPSNTTAITQAIHGLGGVGKTRLAIEYGWHTLEQGLYTAVLFVNCSQQLSGSQDTTDAADQQRRQNSALDRLSVEIAKLTAANLLNIPGIDPTDHQNAVHAVLKELQSRTNWLIVFDNVDEPAMAQAVYAILPQLHNGNTIITSRLTNFAGNIKPLALEKLSPEASQEYVLEKTEKKRLPRENDREKVEELASILDGLPVALEQAAAYINYQEISLEEYLHKFNALEKKLLEFDAQSLGLGDYSQPVLTTWTMTEQQLNPLARSVNTLAAFLAPEAVPLSLFTNQPDGVFDAAAQLDSDFDPDQHKNLSPAEKSDSIEDAIAQLAAFSMIARHPSDPSLKHSNKTTVSNDCHSEQSEESRSVDQIKPLRPTQHDISEALVEHFSIHRLLQQVTRLRLSKDLINSFTQIILKMIANDCPDYDTVIKTNYTWHKTMDSHLSGLIAYTEQLWPNVTDIPESIAASLATQINNLVTFYQDTNRLDGAEPLMRRALEIDETSFGHDHPNVARDLNNLVQLLKATNRIADAEPLMRCALSIDEKSFGPDHPDVARDLNNLAGLLKATNRLKEAEPMYRRALDIRKKSLGDKHPDYATSLKDLAGLLIDTDRSSEAESLYHHVLKIYEESFDSNHPWVATALNDLAQLLKATNRLDDAESLMRRALAIDENSFGPDHPAVAANLNNLATLLQVTNRLDDAEPLMRRALAIDEKSFGPDHPDVARDLNNLALLLQSTNRLDDAEPLMRRALGIDEKSFGPDHPDVAIDLNNLASLLKATNCLDDAKPLMRRALAIDEKSFGPDHPNVAIRLNNLAQLLQATNRLDEAEPMYRRALEIDEKSYGPDHPEVATALNNLAELYRITNRFSEAEPLYRRALAIDEKSFGPDHPNVAIDLNNLAQLLKTTNRLEDAEPLMKRVIEIFEKSYGKEHPNVATALNNLAQLLQATNRLADAEPLMRRALEIDENSLGPDHPKVAIRLNNLAQLLQATNRIKDAEPLMRRALEIDEKSYGPDHPNVAIDLNNLAQLLQATNRLDDAEPLMRRALEIDENSFGPDHPDVARDLNNLALLLQDTNRLKEAEHLMERHLVILLQFTRQTGHPHPHLNNAINNFAGLLTQLGQTKNQITARLQYLAPEFFAPPDNQNNEE
jgi:tetratricopeptide (TPR) repeat protein